MLRREGRREAAGDLRLSIFHLRRYASMLVAEEARRERNPTRRRQLEQEASDLWQ
jgi:hypothetical protein